MIFTKLSLFAVLLASHVYFSPCKALKTFPSSQNDGNIGPRNCDMREWAPSPEGLEAFKYHLCLGPVKPEVYPDMMRVFEIAIPVEEYSYSRTAYGDYAYDCWAYSPKGYSGLDNYYVAMGSIRNIFGRFYMYDERLTISTWTQLGNFGPIWARRPSSGSEEWLKYFRLPGYTKYVNDRDGKKRAFFRFFINSTEKLFDGQSNFDAHATTINYCQDWDILKPEIPKDPVQKAAYIAQYASTCRTPETSNSGSLRHSYSIGWDPTLLAGQITTASLNLDAFTFTYKFTPAETSSWVEEIKKHPSTSDNCKPTMEFLLFESSPRTGQDTMTERDRDLANNVRIRPVLAKWNKFLEQNPWNSSALVENFSWKLTDLNPYLEDQITFLKKWQYLESWQYNTTFYSNWNTGDGITLGMYICSCRIASVTARWNGCSKHLFETVKVLDRA